uniref:Exocyst subunit Exo70 family protein n=1 Tax=Leersia perrieri TaxID=77586 RepID=A0A0D9XTD8_9ORYZ
MNLQEKPWSGVEELIKGWLVALTVMAEALRLTTPELSSSDGGSCSELGAIPARKQISAPAWIAAAVSRPPLGSPDLIDEQSELAESSSGPATKRSFDVATVKEAIIAYSLAEKGRSFSFGQPQRATRPESPGSLLTLFAEASLMKKMCFPDAMASLNRSPEKILSLIDMYAVVSDVSPGLLALLIAGESKRLVSHRITTVLETLSGMVRDILRNLASLIQEEESWRSTVQGNYGIHPVNQYVLNYINLLLDNLDVLNLVLQRGEDEELFPIGEPYQFATEDSSLTGIVTRLVNSLDAMFEDRSKTYAAAGPRYIFLLNNAHFILQQAFMGACWYAQRKRQIERHIKSYLDASWGNIVSCLEPTGGQRRNSLLRRLSVLVEFNALLQATYHTEKLWKINSPQLRSMLRNSVCGKVVSAYRLYLESQVKFETSATYTPEDLEDLLQDLFEG